MILGLPPEAAVGLISTLGGFLMKQQAQRQADQKQLFELTLQKQEANNKSTNDAYQRKAPYLRKLVGTIVILVAFVGTRYFRKRVKPYDLSDLIYILKRRNSK